MSTEPPQDPNAKKLHIWGRPLDSPSSSSTSTPGDAPNDKPATGKPADEKSLEGKDFQQNFPEANGVSLSDAVKSIKGEDFLDVHKSACGRQGLMAGIVLGSLVGGLRFVWRGTLLPFPLRPPLLPAAEQLAAQSCAVLRSIEWTDRG